MDLNKNQFFAYDVVVDKNDNNKRKIFIYKVYLVSYENPKYKCYERRFLRIEEPENIEEAIKHYRKENYYSILEFGFKTYHIECTYIIPSILLSLKDYKIKPLEFVYHSEVINGMSYLIGSVIYIDMNTGKEYLVRAEKFGLETDELVKYVEDIGYEHISKTSLMHHLDKVNKPRILELKQNKKC